MTEYEACQIMNFIAHPLRKVRIVQVATTVFPTA